MTTTSETGTPRWRKKPIALEARQFLDGQENANGRELATWCGGSFHRPAGGEPFIIVPSLEGDHEALIGDWILCGTRSEHWVVREDIFAETYEPADGDQVTVSREDLRVVLAIADDYGVLTWEQERARDRLSATAGDPQ